eukprot:TRINITY_DN1002_c0_g1_i1.p1 TRINITY_DN1002_c0_g1~~TRINITY_DN1002_c0_g1_i1.p1  ORF type:complete len:552 (+),score=89.61 TRINITY_DN1002_c0_g1_i1:477-2132(+)
MIPSQLISREHNIKFPSQKNTINNQHQFNPPPSPSKFIKKVGSSKALVSRLSNTLTLKNHSGCVNTVTWNSNGDRLVSGSDDTNICVYNYNNKGKLLHRIDSGHTANIFCTKFMPNNDSIIVSCAGDSKVKVFAYNEGAFSPLHHFDCHSSRTKKIATHQQFPSIFITCSEDGDLRFFDLRAPHRCAHQPRRSHRYRNPEAEVEENHSAPSSPPSSTSTNNGGFSYGSPRGSCQDTLLLHVTADSSTNSSVRFSSDAVDLYSVDWNKIDSNYLITAGGDPFVRLYDRRNMTECLKKFHPYHNIRSSAHVTGLVYSDDGKQFLGSYSGDTIFLFDVNSSINPEDSNSASPPPSPPSSSSSSFSPTTSRSETHFIESPYYFQKYKGHCNVRTVKEVNFLGSSCDYVVSGSDDGRIFIWDRYSSEIVNILKGDKHVVNICSGHPFDGVVMATSGIESNVKIWEPVAEEHANLSNFQQIMEDNHSQSERRARGNLIPWSIIEHIMNTAEIGQRARVNIATEDEENAENEGEEEDEDEDEDEESEGEGRQIRCAFQ